MTKCNATRDQLESLVMRGLTDSEMALELGVSKSIVCHLRHKHGILKSHVVPRRIGGPTKPTKDAIKMGWTAMINRKKKAAPLGTKFESIDEYLARGGTVTQCAPMGALGDIPPEVA